MKRKSSLELIESNPKVLHGKPCIKGTRIPVYLILEMLASGENKKTIIKEYPQLSENDINEAIRYSAKLTNSITELDF